jgi:DNA-binding CsgD family transcriptional regulator/tetratricopeptide (TPR) repeat protein
VLQDEQDVSVVGPRAEGARLDVLLTQAHEGHPTVALVEGAAGAGKSTVLRQFLRRHPQLPTTAVLGLPWERGRAGALVGRLLAQPPDAAATPSTPGPLDMAQSLLSRWAEQSSDAPALIVVDDAHHADLLSLQALVSAADRARTGVLLLLSRSTDVLDLNDAETADVLDRLAAVRVPIAPFDVDETRLLAARVAAVDLPISVARRLREHTGGRPGHLREVLQQTPRACWSDWQTPLPPPGSVQRRVQRALQRCSPAARSLVEAAAVLGETPLLADAAALAGLEAPLDALDEAWRVGLLAPRAGRGLDALSFSERFARGAVHSSLAPRARHDLHLRAASLLGDETERLRHRVEATPLPDPALADELVALARRKATEGAWAVVADALVDASRISPGRADREDRLLQAVDALAGAGLLEQAVIALPEVEALPTGARRDAVLAYVAVQRGRRNEAVEHLDAAWRHRGADRHTTAVVCQRHVLHALADWDGEALVRWTGRAVELADPGSPAAVESRAIVGLGHAARGQPTLAYTAYRQAVAESPAGPQHQRSRMGLGWLHLAQDDPEAARRELEFAASTVGQAGSTRITLWALAWLARTRFVLGDWPGALHAVDQAEVVLGASGLDLLRPLVHWTGAQVRALRGEDEAVERHLRLGAAAEHDYTVMIVPALLARAHAAEAASDYDAVVRALAPLVVRTPRGGLDEPGFWPWHDIYANALVVTERLDDAEAFLGPLEATAQERQHRSTGARLGYVRGRLLAARGDLRGAERAFEAARAEIAGLPLPYERALVDFAHGMSLRRAGRRRDAAALLATARRAFAGLGAQVYVQRCDRELRTGRPAAGSADAGTDVLTEQERTVATLVATGRTNAEVAASMLLSVKTVQFHLTRVYAKLGIRSRTELAARFPALSAHQ